jgi:hypothetical protein
MIAVLQNGMFSESSTSSDAKMFSATAQAAAIKARYDGGVEVFMATDAGSARDNARKFESLTVRGPADVAVYTAAMLTDFGVVENLRKRLTAARIRVVDDTTNDTTTAVSAASPHTQDAAGATEANVIVVTGHRGPEMSTYLSRLKDTGVLKGKLVAVISCYEPGIETLQSALTGGADGAAAVLFYPEMIKASAVESVLSEFSKIVAAPEFTPARLNELLDRSVDRALEEAVTPAERSEILKLRLLFGQLSRLTQPLSANS